MGQTFGRLALADEAKGDAAVLARKLRQPHDESRNPSTKKSNVQQKAAPSLWIGWWAPNAACEAPYDRMVWRGKVFMLDHCANPSCGKPLHYLREGTVFLFEVSNFEVRGDQAEGQRIEHYWLCGECSAANLLERTSSGEIRLVPRRTLHNSCPGLALDRKAS